MQFLHSSSGVGRVKASPFDGTRLLGKNAHLDRTRKCRSGYYLILQRSDQDRREPDYQPDRATPRPLTMETCSRLPWGVWRARTENSSGVLLA